MKRIIFCFFILLLILSFGCKKPEPKITYPLTYDSKLNLLLDSDFVLTPGVYYSAAAFLPEGTSIKWVCKPPNDKEWGGAGFVILGKIGYKYRDYYPDSLVFDARGEDDYVNVDVTLGSSPTVLDFIIFENNDQNVSRKKTIRNFNPK
jgi:hypothetical protein